MLSSRTIFFEYLAGNIRRYRSRLYKDLSKHSRNGGVNLNNERRQVKLYIQEVRSEMGDSINVLLY